MNAHTRIVIIDPHELMRAGIRLACESRDSLEVVGEADNIETGRMLLSEHTPDVLVLDMATCHAEELSVVSRLRAEFPGARILVFTAVDSADAASHVIASGASGFLVKTAGLDEIAVAIRCVHQGRTTITYTAAASVVDVNHSLPTQSCDSSVAKMAAKLASGLRPTDSASSGPSCRPLQAGGSISITEPPAAVGPAKGFAGLSERETEVLGLLAEGLTNKQVAERLFLSVKTVETYRSRIMKKNDLRDRSELVRFAREQTTQVTFPTE